MNHIKKIILGTLLVAVTAFAIVPASTVAAIDVFQPCDTVANKTSAVCKSKDDDASEMIQIIITTMLTLLGSISVIMIIVGGIRYTTADADASKLKNARDTIIYSVVGLVVAILSYAIVNFVLDQLKT